MFAVALKSVLARKRRLASTAIAIVLGVTFMSGTLVLSDTLDRAVHGLINAAFTGVDSVVRSKSSQTSDFGPPQRNPIPASNIAAVRSVPGVRAVAGVITGLPVIFGKDGKPLGSSFGPPTIALNWIPDTQLRTGRIIAGRAPHSGDEVALDRKTAADNRFHVGDSIKVQTPEAVADYRVVGIAGLGTNGDLASGAQVVIFDTATAQRVLGKAAAFDYIEVGAARGVDERTISARLRSSLGDRLDVITGSAFIDEQQEGISKIIGIFTSAILAFGYIAIFVGVFIIYNTFSILIAQRTREMALLRAVGASRRQILASVMVEAAATGLVAGVVGMFAGYVLALGLKSALGNVLSLPGTLPRLTGSTVLVSVLTGFLVTVLSAMGPAVRATRIPPLAALSEVAFEHPGTSKFRHLFGTTLLAAGGALVAVVLTRVAELGLLGIGIGAGLIFLSVLVLGPVFAGPASRIIGFPLTRWRGLAGRLARENAARNPKRTAAAAAALTIGVALVTVIAVMASSVKASVTASTDVSLAKVDLIADSGQHFPGAIPYSVEDQIRRVPGVERVSPLRFAFVDLLNSVEARDKQAAARAAGEAGTGSDETEPGQSGIILGVHGTEFLRMVNLGDVKPAITSIDDGDVIVLADFAERNKWKVGDALTVRSASANGTGIHHLRLAATFTARLGGGQIFTNLTTFDQVAPAEYQVDNAVYVALSPGVAVKGAQRAIKSVVAKGAPAASVTDVAGFVAERTSMFDAFLAMIYVLMSLAILIALFGIGNTLSLSILERTREIGLLRAVGMGRRQIRISIRWESAIIAVFGTLLGIVIGTILAIAFVVAFNEQTISPVIPAAQLISIVVAGMIAGVLAAVRPARRASRLDILEAVAAS